MGQACQKIVGRYALFDEIAAGGMATVHLGRLLGPVGFSRTVAIKRLHPQFAKDPEFVSMLVDEARLAARIRHLNVVPTLDIVQSDNELFLVMDYVPGVALSQLLRSARTRGQPLAPRIAVPVICGMLHGLHAAHNARGESGEALHLVHRDVSPHNVLVGTDGVARVLDFGIAKARGRLQTTREGQIKGKLAYMAPEQLRGEDVGPAADVYAAGVVLWEALAGRRLFDAETEAGLLASVLRGEIMPPSDVRPELSAGLDAIVMNALARHPADRFPSARAMAVALERASVVASATEIGEWVEDMATKTLGLRAARLAQIESQSEVRAKISPQVGATTGAVSSGTGSQLSATSVLGSERRAHPATWIGALLGLVLIGALVTMGFLQRGGAVTTGSAAPSAAASHTATASHTAVAPVQASAPALSSAPLATASASAERPSASASAQPLSASKSNAPTKRRPRTITTVRRAPPPVKRPAPPRKSGCVPPYSFDAEGNKVYKARCL